MSKYGRSNSPAHDDVCLVGEIAAGWPSLNRKRTYTTHILSRRFWTAINTGRRRDDGRAPANKKIKKYHFPSLACVTAFVTSLHYYLCIMYTYTRRYYYYYYYVYVDRGVETTNFQPTVTSRAKQVAIRVNLSLLPSFVIRLYRTHCITLLLIYNPCRLHMGIVGNNYIVHVASRYTTDHTADIDDNAIIIFYCTTLNENNTVKL